MRVVISSLGLKDLQEIVDSIASDNPAAAHKLADDLEAFCTETLAPNPKLGKPADELVPGLRVAAKRNYRIC